MEQRLAALGHEDRFVRSAFLEVLSRYADTGAAASHAAMAAIGRFGWDEAFLLGSPLERLPLDEETGEWLVRTLDAFLGGAAGAGDPPPEFRVRVLLSWLEHAPPAVATRYGDLIRGWAPAAVKAGALGGLRTLTGSVGALADRRVLAGLDDAEAWKSWENRVVACGSPEPGDGGDEGFPFEAVGALRRASQRVAQGAFTPGQERELIGWIEAGAAMVADEEGGGEVDWWRVGGAAMVAGHRRLGAAVPGLLGLLASDWDWWCEEVVEALQRIGGAAALRPVVERFEDMVWEERLYASGGIAYCDAPAFEDEVIRLASLEDIDALVACHLGEWLALAATPKALGAAKRLLEDWSDDVDAREMLNVVYAVHVLLGHSGPELDGWRDELEAGERNFQALIGHSAERPRAPAGTGGGGHDGGTLIDFPGGQEPIGAPAPPDPFAGVGRNQPCPCGSGKKFKKCCLNKR